MWHKIFRPKYMFIPFAINHVKYASDYGKQYKDFREVFIFGFRIIAIQVSNLD